MSTFGLFGLVIAFAGVAIGSVCLLASQALRGTRRASSADTFAWAGAVAHILAFVALTFCCGLLVFCFMTGDFSIEYVLLEHSEAEGALGFFAGIDNAKFRNQVRPGDTLTLEATIVKSSRRLCVAEVKASVGDTVCATATQKYVLAPAA